MLKELRLHKYPCEVNTAEDEDYNDMLSVGQCYFDSKPCITVITQECGLDAEIVLSLENAKVFVDELLDLITEMEEEANESRISSR